MRTILILLAGIVTGIALVVACGTSGGIDAGIDAQAATCTTCEKPITARRYYVVRDRNTIKIEAGKVAGIASCNPGTGDILVSGGCTLYSSDAVNYEDGFLKHVALLNSSLAAATPKGGLSDVNDSWRCYYDNPDNNPNLEVVTTAICFHPEPQ